MTLRARVMGLLCLGISVSTDASAISLRDFSAGAQSKNEAEPLASLRSKADLVAVGSRLAEDALFSGGKFSLGPQQRYPYYLLTPDEPSDYTVENVAETRVIDILVKDYGLSRSAVDENGRGMNCYYTLKAAIPSVFSQLIELNLMEINKIAGVVNPYEAQQLATLSGYVKSQLDPLGQYCGNGGLTKITAMFDDFAGAYSTGLSARLDREKTQIANEKLRAAEQQSRVADAASTQRAADATRQAELDRQQAQLDAVQKQRDDALRKVQQDRKQRLDACEKTPAAKQYQAAALMDAGRAMVAHGQKRLDADDANARVSRVNDLEARRAAGDEMLAGKGLIDAGFQSYREAGGGALSPQWVKTGQDPCQADR